MLCVIRCRVVVCLHQPRDTSGVVRDSYAKPGPGAYNTQGQHRQWGRRTGEEGFVFGSAEQRIPEPALVEASKKPGPGAYATASTLAPYQEASALPPHFPNTLPPQLIHTLHLSRAS
jgi:hypothetical protein